MLELREEAADDHRVEPVGKGGEMSSADVAVGAIGGGPVLGISLTELSSQVPVHGTAALIANALGVVALLSTTASLARWQRSRRGRL